MSKVMIVVMLLAMFFVFNFGFSLSFCSAAGPYDPWSMSIFMYRANPGQWSSGPSAGTFGPYWGAQGQSGSPQWGFNYNKFGYNSFNPWEGPSMPGNGGYSTMGFYDYRNGAPVGPGMGGGDGVSYGYPGPFMGGYNHLYGLYGYGMPGPGN